MIYFGEATTAALVHRAKREQLQLHVASGTVFTVEFLHKQKRTLGYLSPNQFEAVHDPATAA